MKLIHVRCGEEYPPGENTCTENPINQTTCLSVIPTERVM